ncbi:galactose oxidase, partial [Bimuria novae-zelandiae CBS 107.79]
WVNLTSLSTPRQEHATVAVDNNTIAVVGGVERIGNDSVQLNVLTTNLIEPYGILSNTWRTAAPLPIAVNHPNAAATNGHIYLLGGLVNAQEPPISEADWIATGNSYDYDPTADSWTSLPSLPSMPNGTERGSAVVGVRGEMIYVAGGMTVLNFNGQDAVTSVIAFNTTSVKWQRVPLVAANLPEGRQHAAGGVVGDTLYVVSGRWFQRTNVRDEVFELDLRNQTAGWKTSLGRMPTARDGIAGGVVGSRFSLLAASVIQILRTAFSLKLKHMI